MVPRGITDYGTPFHVEAFGDPFSHIINGGGITQLVKRLVNSPHYPIVFLETPLG